MSSSAICASAASSDGRLSPPERPTTAEAYADLALKALRQSMQAGFNDAEHLRKDPDLDPLRSRPDFKRLLSELKAAAQKE